MRVEGLEYKWYVGVPFAPPHRPRLCCETLWLSALTPPLFFRFPCECVTEGPSLKPSETVHGRLTSHGYGTGRCSAVQSGYERYRAVWSGSERRGAIQSAWSDQLHALLAECE